MRYMSRLSKYGKSVKSFLVAKQTVKLALIGAILAVTVTGFSDDALVLPLTDVVANVKTLVGDAIVAMGGIVVVCIGGQIGFAVLKAFGRWLKKAIG